MRPVDGGELGRVDALEVFVGEIEGEDDAGEVGVGQVGEAGVAKEMVAVPEANDAEIGGVAEHARGGEAGVGAPWIAAAAPKSLNPGGRRCGGAGVCKWGLAFELHQESLRRGISGTLRVQITRLFAKVEISLFPFRDPKLGQLHLGRGLVPNSPKERVHREPRQEARQ